MALENTSVVSVAELIAHLLSSGSDQRKWFRGQGCDSRSLKPSLVRAITPYDAGILMATEKRLITRFRQRSLPFWPEGYPQQDWEHLFAMQHHGVPTRLLDWSENALIGAYFAADHDPERCECRTGSCKPTLWVLDPVALNRHNSRLDGYGDAISILATSDPAIDQWAPGTDETRFAPWPIAMYGTHNSARIAAQQGTFTVAGKMDAPLNEVPAVNDHAVLEKVTIDCDREVILTDLRILGVTRAAVFPDLPGLASDLAAEELPR